MQFTHNKKKRFTNQGFLFKKNIYPKDPYPSLE